MRRAARAQGIGAATMVLLCGCEASRPAVIVVPSKGGKQTPLRVAAAETPVVPPAAFALAMSFRPCVTIRGQLYCPETISPQVPFASAPPIAGLQGVVSVAFGRDYWCAALEDGHVKCAGSNHFGQLGAGSAAEQLGVTTLPHVAGAKKVAAGPFTACAIHRAGTVSCWGKNQSGESGSSTQYLEGARELVEAEVVPGLDGVQDIAIGWSSSCAIKSSGEVLCWGKATLPDHVLARGAQHEAPALIPSLAGATSIAANESSFCAVRDDKVVCWGDLMMLVKGSRVATNQVLDIPSPKGVSLGANHGCAVTKAGDVYCFGTNSQGALGVKPSDYEVHAPEKVLGLPPVIDVRCGPSGSCAVTASSDLYCWGGIGDEEHDLGGVPTKMRVLAR